MRCLVGGLLVVALTVVTALVQPGGRGVFRRGSSSSSLAIRQSRLAMTTATQPPSAVVEVVTDNPSGCVVDNLTGFSEQLQEPLLNDIERLTGYLGEVIQRENPQVFDLYERFRAHALRREKLDDKDAINKMIECSIKITPENALGVVRAFTQTLNLINSAEVHHRMRLLRNADIVSGRFSPLPMREDSVAGTCTVLLQRAVKDKVGVDQRKKEIFQALTGQRVDIVLTAHPTEVNRRTLLRKYRRISESLAVLDRSDLSPYEKAQAEETLRREISSIWGSDEIRRNKPTPQMEAKGGMAIVETVLWDAVPEYLRRLSAQCVDSLGPEYKLPLTAVPIVFSSWMGGDRDGNPNVTPKVLVYLFSHPAPFSSLFSPSIRRRAVVYLSPLCDVPAPGPTCSRPSLTLTVVNDSSLTRWKISSPRSSSIPPPPR